MRIFPHGLRSLLFLAGLILSSGQGFADTITYKNARFGTQISFPAGLFTQTEALPENGDGVLFTHPDGGSLAVFGYNNGLNFSPKEVAQSVREIVREDFSITYERITDTWLVQSGYEDGLIYYQRLEFGPENIIHGFLMKWPESLRPKYDKVVGAIGKSLKSR